MVRTEISYGLLPHCVRGYGGSAMPANGHLVEAHQTASSVSTSSVADTTHLHGTLVRDVPPLTFLLDPHASETDIVAELLSVWLAT